MEIGALYEAIDQCGSQWRWRYFIVIDYETVVALAPVNPSDPKPFNLCIDPKTFRGYVENGHVRKWQ
tara:strand:- start:8226 stop:8426 length:201 start_codon:yes stop_codon:yes gene_type:complete